MKKLILRTVKENSILIIPLIIKAVFVLTPLLTIFGFYSFYYKQQVLFNNSIELLNYSYILENNISFITRPVNTHPEEKNIVSDNYNFLNCTNKEKVDRSNSHQINRGLRPGYRDNNRESNFSLGPDIPYLASGARLLK